MIEEVREQELVARFGAARVAAGGPATSLVQCVSGLVVISGTCSQPPGEGPMCAPLVNPVLGRAKCTPTLVEGGTEIKTLNQPLSMSVSQTLAEGINYSVSWGGTKSTSNSSFNSYNPALSSNLAIQFSQPLLQNRGTYVNRLNLMVARSRLRRR